MRAAQTPESARPFRRPGPPPRIRSCRIRPSFAVSPAMNCALDRFFSDAAGLRHPTVLCDRFLPFGVEPLRETRLQREPLLFRHFFDQLEDIVNGNLAHRLTPCNDDSSAPAS